MGGEGALGCKERMYGGDGGDEDVYLHPSQVGSQFTTLEEEVQIASEKGEAVHELGGERDTYTTW